MNSSSEPLSVHPAQAIGEQAVPSFTPGPWAVCVRAQNNYWVAGQTIGAESPADARRVCDVTDWASPMGLANARLIAAAPELLEALQEMVPLIGLDGWQVSVNGDTAKARAAIAKALGAPQ